MSMESKNNEKINNSYSFSIDNCGSQNEINLADPLTVGTK